jgi:hypothetical protein
MTSLDDVQPTVPPAARGPLLADRSVAVVHEWFGATGGSENVFLAIADLVPHARRIVLWADRDVEVKRLGLHETWLARTPLRRSKALALPLMPLAWRTVGEERYDVVISSSHAFAHTVRLGPPQRTRHLSYVHCSAAPAVRSSRSTSGSAGTCMPTQRTPVRCRRGSGDSGSATPS